MIGKEKLILHVAANGCDGWSGKISEPNGTDGPLASIVAARDRIRALRSSRKLNTPVEVLIHAGRYEITETIIFEDADLSEENTNITFKKAGDGEVILVGGCILDKYTIEEGGIIKYDLAATGLKNLKFNQLFCNGIRQIKARYPKLDKENPYFGGYMLVEGPVTDPRKPSCYERDRFICRDPRIKNWKNLAEVELFIYARYNWYNNIVKLKSYNPETGEVLLQEPTTYSIYPQDIFFFQNVKEELSEPGEWYLDQEQQVVYFCPPEGMKAEDIVVTVPVVENLIEIKSAFKSKLNFCSEKIDWTYSGGEVLYEEKQASAEKGYLNFEGLILEGCEGAAVLVKRAKAVKVEACVIRGTGTTGIVMLDCLQSQVIGCDIYETGANGVYVSGGLRNGFESSHFPAENNIENNYIHHVGVIHKGTAGISINGEGIHVAHNYIHDCPRWGIFSRGNDHLIEYNHIRHVNIETSDTGAINTCDRDYKIHGTKILYNHIHDIPGFHKVEGKWKSPGFAFGIYLDDFSSGYEVRGNLTYRTSRAGMYIHGGKDNIVENNMFLKSNEEMCFLLSSHGGEYRTQGTTKEGFRNNKFRNNIFAVRNPDTALYNMWSGDYEKLKDYEYVFENNVYYNFESEIYNIYFPEATKSCYEKWLEFSSEKGSIVDDPEFMDFDGDNYTLKESSCALKSGFEPLPVDKMGLYNSGKRASWPIKEAEGFREKPIVVE